MTDRRALPLRAPPELAEIKTSSIAPEPSADIPEHWARRDQFSIDLLPSRRRAAIHSESLWLPASVPSTRTREETRAPRAPPASLRAPVTSRRSNEPCTVAHGVFRRV